MELLAVCEKEMVCHISKKSRLVLAHCLCLASRTVGRLRDIRGFALDGEQHLRSFLIVLGEVGHLLLLLPRCLPHLQDLAVGVEVRLLEGRAEQVNESVDVVGGRGDFFLLELKWEVEVGTGLF